jgi:ArsR family transcriptional regulator
MTFDNEYFFAALSHPARLRIVVLLSTIDEICVCELTEILSISQPVLSKQLAQLKKSGLVTCRRQGKWMFYRINDDLSQWAKAVIEETKKGLTVSSPFNEDLQHYQNMKQQDCC